MAYVKVAKILIESGKNILRYKKNATMIYGVGANTARLVPKMPRRG